MRESVGFISLGNMGVPAVQNLLKAGHPLSVFNRTVPRADGLCEHGATRATSPRALAEQNLIVLSIVADDTGLKAIAPGDDGVLAGLTPGKIHVDMRTVSPDISKDPDHQYGARGAHFIAVPVWVGRMWPWRPNCGSSRPVHLKQLSAVGRRLMQWGRPLLWLGLIRIWRIPSSWLAVFS